MSNPPFDEGVAPFSAQMYVGSVCSSAHIAQASGLVFLIPLGGINPQSSIILGTTFPPPSHSGQPSFLCPLTTLVSALNHYNFKFCSVYYVLGVTAL